VGLQYTIEYKKGTANQAVDALSRHPSIPVAEVLAITVGTPEWLSKSNLGMQQIW
jgi:hypothetical protein